MTAFQRMRNGGMRQWLRHLLQNRTNLFVTLIHKVVDKDQQIHPKFRTILTMKLILIVNLLRMV